MHFCQRSPRLAGAALGPDRHASGAARPSRPSLCHGAGCSRQSDGDRQSTETHGCLPQVDAHSEHSAASPWVRVCAPADASRICRGCFASWRSAFGRRSGRRTWRIALAAPATWCASCVACGDGGSDVELASHAPRLSGGAGLLVRTFGTPSSSYLRVRREAHDRACGRGRRVSCAENESRRVITSPPVG